MHTGYTCLFEKQKHAISKFLKSSNKILHVRIILIPIGANFQYKI
jgi:hypothetical protein